MTLLVDTSELNKFINILSTSLSNTPELKFYIQIQSRNKYSNDINIGTNHVLFRKLVNLENLATTITNATPNNIPLDTCVVYITPEPINLQAASKDLICDIIKCENINNYDVCSKYLSFCQKNRLIKDNILDVDLDNKDLFEEVKNLLIELNIDVIACIETHGGYHFLTNVLSFGKGINTILYHGIKDINSRYEKNQIDMIKNNLCPIPGTIQGGFKVKMIDLK